MIIQKVGNPEPSRKKTGRIRKPNDGQYQTQIHYENYQSQNRNCINYLFSLL